MIVWACCSSRRTGMIAKKTFATLARGNFQGSLYLVVPHEEVADYVPVAAAAPIHCILIGATKGLPAQRKHLRGLFPEGTQIVFIDDDISAVKVKSGTKLEHIDDLNTMAEYCFDELGKTGSLLWSVYPVCNSLFMKHRIAKGNCICVGAFYGCINDERLEEPTNTQGVGEDYIRQLKEQVAGRPHLRFDFLGVETRFAKKGTGGLSDDYHLRPELRKALLATLIDNYPTLIKERIKKGGFPDIRFIQRPDYTEIVTFDPALLADQSTPEAAGAEGSAAHAHADPPLQ